MKEGTTVCHRSYTCLEQMRRVFALAPLHTWSNPCVCCVEGAARQEDRDRDREKAKRVLVCA
jgi:hypothetical protein